jgi:hydrogenase maturation factor
MRVVSASADSAVCEDDQGAQHEVATDLVAPVRAGETVLVHAGVAIA